MFDDFVILAAGMKLLYAAAGVLMLVALSRWLDVRVERAITADKFKGFGQAVRVIRSSALATAIYYGLRIVALALVVAALMGCTPVPAAAASFPDRYDGDIRRAVETWWPDYPFPRAWKAQLWQESRLDPAAVSPVGARGLAQFMPGTWSDMRQALRLGPVASPHDDIAIQAGAYYMAKLRRGWSAPRPQDVRHQLAQASYNAGFGNILAAQRACGGARDWSDIAPCLPGVTGHHAAETIGYVQRIAKWRTMMEAGL